MLDDEDESSELYNINVNCGAGKLLDPLLELRSIVQTVSNSTARIEESTNEIRNLLVEIKEVTDHVHESHDHTLPHYAEDGTDTPLGSPWVHDVPSEVDLIIQEANLGIDKDQNGMIYGKDFMIDDNDPDKPDLIRDVDIQLAYSGINVSKTPIVLTWESYLSTIPWR